jgi:hypothetical protein
MKKLFSLLFTIMLIMSLLPSNSLASSSNEEGLKMTDEELENMKEELIKYDVNNEIAENLAHKIKNGQPLDSMIMDIEDAISFKVKKHADDSEEYIYTFPDGSITVVGVEYAPFYNNGGFTIQSTGISEGSCSSGSGYTSCTNRKIYYLNPGVWEMSFRANYTYVSGGYDYISWAGNESIWMVGGTVGNPYCRIIRSTETSSQKAEARFSAYLYLGGQYGTQTRSISLILGNDKAVAQGNTYY